MRIAVVRVDSGATLDLEVESKMSISEIKLLLKPILNVQPSRQIIYYLGKILQDDQTIAQLEICNEYKLHFKVRSSFKLLIKHYRTGRVVPVSVTYLSSVSDIMDLLSHHVNLRPFQLHLYFGGKKLGKNSLLSYYNICNDGEFIDWFQKDEAYHNNATTLNIVSSFTGNVFSINQPRFQKTIRYIKRQVEMFEHIPIDLQTLSFLGRRLSEVYPKNAFLHDRATVYLIDTSLVQGRIVIKINIIPTSFTFTVQVNRNLTVGQLKQKIQDSQQIPIEAQLIYFPLQQLSDNDATLCSYDVTNGSTLSLTYIKVRFMINSPNRGTFTVWARVTDTINMIKVSIREEESLPPDQQLILYVDSQQLVDDSSIKDSLIFSDFCLDYLLVD